MSSAASADKKDNKLTMDTLLNEKISKIFNQIPPFVFTTAMIFFIQLISVIFVLNVDDCYSPLVLFSYWRNKIS
jgi:hypothetical protein